MPDSILLAKRLDDGTALLTLNRPERRNALTIGLMTAIVNKLRELEQAGEYRAVIFRGAGPAFCAGLDLVEAANTDMAERGADAVAEMLERVSDSPLVTIAAAHGAAYAGGAGLLAACDFAVGSDDLRICFPEVRRGLVPALVSTVLTSRLGASQLRELLLLAEPIDAARSLQLGLIQKTVATGQIVPESLRISKTIQLGAPGAIRQTKQLLREIRSLGSTAAVESALRIHTLARSSAEAQEGLSAFRQRRDPNW